MEEFDAADITLDCSGDVTVKIKWLCVYRDPEWWERALTSITFGWFKPNLMIGYVNYDG